MNDSTIRQNIRVDHHSFFADRAVGHCVRMLCRRPADVNGLIRA